MKQTIAVFALIYWVNLKTNDLQKKLRDIYEHQQSAHIFLAVYTRQRCHLMVYLDIKRKKTVCCFYRDLCQLCCRCCFFHDYFKIECILSWPFFSLRSSLRTSYSSKRAILQVWGQKLHNFWHFMTLCFIAILLKFIIILIMVIK